MASIICPHCSTKIRLTRKPKEPISPRPPTEDQTQAKAKKLPTPDPARPDRNEPQTTTPEDPNGFPKIITRRTRKRVNLNNLKLAKPDQPGAIQPLTPTRLKQQSTNVPPPEVKPPSNTQRTPSDGSSILPAGRRLRGNSPTKPNLVSKTNTPSSQTTCNSRQNKLDNSPEHTEAEIDTENVGTDHSKREDEISLLPPKFLVADIEANQNVVVLPSATGGTQVVSRTEVTVSHGDQTIKLVASSPEELQRIRLIESLVAVVIAGIMLAIAVWILL